MDRLRQRADFLAVANGARVNSAAFVVQRRRRDDLGPVRVGFTVTKKNGTATERNRIRRRLRELVKRLRWHRMRPHSDYVLVGRRAALKSRFCDHARRSPLGAPSPRPAAPKARAHKTRGASRKTEMNDETFTMTENRNTILAVILSGLVLLGWQYFYNVPQMEKQRAGSSPSRPRRHAGAACRRTATPRPRRPRVARAASANAPANRQAAAAAPVVSREAAIAASAPRQDRQPRA